MPKMPIINKVRDKIINTDNLVLKVSQWKKKQNESSLYKWML